MEFKTACCGPVPGPGYLALAIQALRTEKGKRKGLFALVCQSPGWPGGDAYVTLGLVDWFRYGCFPDFRQAEWSLQKQLESLLEGEKDFPKACISLAGLVATNEGILMFARGKARIMQVGMGLGGTVLRCVLPGTEELNMEWGLVEEEADLILGTEDFLSSFSGEELGQCVARCQGSEERMEKCLEELNREALRRGAVCPGAIWVCAREGHGGGKS